MNMKEAHAEARAETKMHVEQKRIRADQESDWKPAHEPEVAKHCSPHTPLSSLRLLRSSSLRLFVPMRLTKPEGVSSRTSLQRQAADGECGGPGTQLSTFCEALRAAGHFGR